MADGTMVAGDDPADYTVDQVTDFLKGADDDERRRVLEAEQDGQARKGILEGPQATQDGPEVTGEGDGPTDDDAPTSGPAEATYVDAFQAQEASRDDGYLGDTGDTPEGTEPVKPASESAPEGVDTDREAGVLKADDDTSLADAPATVSDQEAPDLEGEAYQRGYVGELPHADDRPDLTLQGVLKNQGK